MVDWDDADDMSMLAFMGPGGWIGFILCVIAIIFICVAASNDSECQKKSCPDGQKPRLMEHSCLCTTEAK